MVGFSKSLSEIAGHNSYPVDAYMDYDSLKNLITSFASRRKKVSAWRHRHAAEKSQKKTRSHHNTTTGPGSYQGERSPIFSARSNRLRSSSGDDLEVDSNSPPPPRSNLVDTAPLLQLQSSSSVSPSDVSSSISVPGNLSSYGSGES